MINYIII